MPKKKAVKLPPLLERKLYKTGQTRGADDDVIYQNRVSRNSTALIPYRWLTESLLPPNMVYENGFIVLIDPADYFGLATDEAGRAAVLSTRGLVLGSNALVFYQKRIDWTQTPPLSTWRPATSRTQDLGGQFVARIAGTTSSTKGGERHGFTSGGMKGAGIRVYEYASSATIQAARLQLEALYWLSPQAVETCVQYGMREAEAIERRDATLLQADSSGLLDFDRLRSLRVLNDDGIPCCPLCRIPTDPQGFFTRVAQAEGREVHDLTVTSLNLFHIHELRVGVFNHRPYNVAWGCHHCNMVAKDVGISETIEWMRGVLIRNDAYKPNPN